MDVFAPADRPLVVFAGGSEEKSTLRTALSRVLGAVGLLAVASLAVQAVVGDLPVFGGDGAERDGGDAAAGGATPTPDGPSILGGAGGSTPTPEPQATPAPRVSDEAVRTAAEGAAGLPPGLLFFAGGLFVLAVVAAIWYIR